jgi:transglutaminase-like putative cysteine protease
MFDSGSVAVASEPIAPTLRPIGVYAMAGLALEADQSLPCLLSIDRVRGYLLRLDPRTGNTTVLNPRQMEPWLDVADLCLAGDRLWFARDCQVFWCDRETLTPTLFAELPYPANGIAVWESLVYVTCQKSGYIHSFERTTGEWVAKFSQPGVGTETLDVDGDHLWVCDRLEQTVYCCDRATGEICYSALTPFSSPTGIAFCPGGGGQNICYIAYAQEEPYLRDDPNGEAQGGDPYQLAWRDRTFVHPLYIKTVPAEHYTLSNGYLVELSYVEELLPLDAVTINQVVWRIALPSDTLRQRVRQVEAIGHPLEIEEQDGQKVAVFRFDQIQPFQGGLFGWRVVMEMYGLKYCLTPQVAGDETLSVEMQERYLVDDDELAMDSETIQRAARSAVGTETNVLRKMLKIRNYVYDRLSYGIQPHIDTPDVALARGVGSCGEYVGVILALARLSGIACRTIGRYKCPAHNDRFNVPLEPEFNHVWIEFYLPGVGWLPMESNVDDVIERGPYPERFFMGLAWFHTEIGKGISFEKMRAADLPESVRLGDLAINHIRFRILEELVPYI